MPDTHGIRRLFWHKIRLQPDSPRHHRYATHEYEYPYRRANSHVLRLFGRSGLVLGWWHGGGLDEESEEYADHLNEAVQGRTLIDNERFKRNAAEISYTVLP